LAITPLELQVQIAYRIKTEDTELHSTVSGNLPSKSSTANPHDLIESAPIIPQIPITGKLLVALQIK